MTTSELVTEVGHKHKYTKQQIHEMRMRLRTYFMFRANEPYSNRYLFDTSCLLFVNEDLFNRDKKNAYFYTLYLRQCQEEVRFYLAYTLHKIIDACYMNFEIGTQSPEMFQAFDCRLKPSNR